jgi:hypothetical protein
MNKKQLIVFITISLVILWFSVAFAASGIDQELLEANTHFTYKAKPIHPGLIEEFNTWLSDDNNPITISVDVVAASDTNEYSDSYVELKPNGYVFINKENGEYFYYKWLGRLKNGLQVLEVAEGGGGSGEFKSLFFVKFDKGIGITPEGKQYDRLLMTIVRTYTLGDRDSGRISVSPDKVILGKSQYRDKPVILRFE